eukprot:COSAG03_NODE_1069_length_4905_cov_17.427710_3_plen_256_part_00
MFPLTGRRRARSHKHSLSYKKRASPAARRPPRAAPPARASHVLMRPRLATGLFFLGVEGRRTPRKNSPVGSRRCSSTQDPHLASPAGPYGARGGRQQATLGQGWCLGCKRRRRSACCCVDGTRARSTGGSTTILSSSSSLYVLCSRTTSAASTQTDRLCVCLPACLSVCWRVCLSVCCLSVCLSACLSVYLSICLSAQRTFCIRTTTPLRPADVRAARKGASRRGRRISCGYLPLLKQCSLTLSINYFVSQSCPQ